MTWTATGAEMEMAMVMLQDHRGKGGEAEKA
jgi:hypothetical protein